MTPSPTLPQMERGSIRKLLRRSLRYLRPYWIEYLVVILGIILTQIFSVSFTVSPKLIVDEAITPQDWGRFWVILRDLGWLFLISTLLNLAADYMIGRAEDELKKDLRLELFTALQYIPSRFFTQTQPGEIVALFASELITFRDALRTLLPNAFAALLQLGLVVSALIALDWRLALAVGAALPIVILIPRTAIRWAGEADYRSKTSDARAAFAVQDNVQAQAVVRAFGLEKAEIQRFKARIGRDKKEPVHGWKAVWPEIRGGFQPGVRRSYFLKRLVGTLTNLQNLILNSVVIIVGGYMAFSGQLTVATFLTFLPLLAKAGDAITKLTTFFNDLISASTGLERLDLFSGQATMPQEELQTIRLENISKEITFSDVHFSHSSERMILNGINCTIPAGGLTALVGRSGTGKSTLLHLLIRFYTPLSGQITVDGMDLYAIQYDNLHQQIGVVLQEPVLLNTSIRANIALTKPEASQEEVEAAAQAAGVHEDIMRMPQGYETVAGEAGKLLSPGQRQRIALARALLRNPSLLVLDEPTAALDPETEQAVMDTLQQLNGQHTLLMVTHRLSAVARLAQKIVVLDQGVVAEQGNHEHLLNNEGLYARFWQLQSGFTVSGDGRMAVVTPDRLRAIPLFENLDLPLLENIAGQFTASNFDQDQYIFYQGDPGTRFYIIVRGKVAVQFSGFDGKVINLDVLQDGDYFGEISLLQDSPRSASVKAMLPTLTLSLERSQFLKLVEESAAVRQAVEEAATKRNLAQATRRGRGKSKLSVLDELVDE
ncbi:MAG: ATP-binding cassette domain-containing protein [Anaerolineales bacterium]|nr:ATP-binding cassette domain-containing protein [Anaerolineales bacterium]